MNKHILTVSFEYENIRIDTYISQKLESVTRSSVCKLIENGKVTVNGKTVMKSYSVCENDTIEIVIDEPKNADILAEDISLDIVYEDDDLLVVNKSKGMVVHPAPGNYSGTLVNALMYHCGNSLSGINGVLRPGIVHRIDKDTSGLLIVSKNDFSHLNLASQIKEHSFTREYTAVVYGKIKDDEGVIDAPIGRDRIDRKKMSVTEQHSRNSVTHYTVIERLSGFSYIKCRLETGRTHQIRVHMAYIGHPVAGDPVYGPKKVITELHGQCLHAGKIGFVHPRSGEYMEFTAKEPEVFERFLSKLQKNSDIHNY